MAVLILTVWFFCAWQAARWLIVSAPLPKADAIVMLSGSATFRERTQKVAALYHRGLSEKIILTNDNHQSGWSSREQRNLFYYEEALAELRRLGVPRQNIEVLLSPVNGTYEEAVLLRRYSEANEFHSILLVTSAYHSRRALTTFRCLFSGSKTQVGLQPVETGLQSPSPATWWLHLLGWETVPTEYPKMLYYWFRFGRSSHDSSTASPSRIEWKLWESHQIDCVRT